MNEPPATVEGILARIDELLDESRRLSDLHRTTLAELENLLDIVERRMTGAPH